MKVERSSSSKPPISVCLKITFASLQNTLITSSLKAGRDRVMRFELN